MSSIEAAFFGQLPRDAERKTSKSGKTYLSFTVRVGDDDAAQWLFVRCFDPDAIERADKFVKCARVYVEGKLSLNEWHDKDGLVKTGLSVMSWHCRLSQIGRQKDRKLGNNYHGAPANRLEKPSEKGGGGPGFYDDPIPFEMESR